MSLVTLRKEVMCNSFLKKEMTELSGVEYNLRIYKKSELMLMRRVTASVESAAT